MQRLSWGIVMLDKVSESQRGCSPGCSLSTLRAAAKRSGLARTKPGGLGWSYRKVKAAPPTPLPVAQD